MDIAKSLRLKVCSDPTAVYAQVHCATLLQAAIEIERLRDALRFIAESEPLTFAECSVAEQIIGRAKAALTNRAMPTPEAQWEALARNALDEGMSEQEFVKHVHSSNRAAARKAYNMVTTNDYEKELRDSIRNGPGSS